MDPELINQLQEEKLRRKQRDEERKQVLEENTKQMFENLSLYLNNEFKGFYFLIFTFQNLMNFSHQRRIQALDPNECDDQRKISRNDQSGKPSDERNDRSSTKMYPTIHLDYRFFIIS